MTYKMAHGQHITKHICLIHPTIDSMHFAKQFPYLEGDNLEISFTGLDHGPSVLGGRLEMALAVPGVCAKAIEMEQGGADAIVLDCMGDIGVEQARECVSIPVFGPYETSLHVASLLSNNFGVVTMMDEVVGPMEASAKQYGAADRLSSVRSIKMSVEQMHADGDELDIRLIKVAEQMVIEEGITALVLGCAEMQGAEETLAKALQKRNIDIPIIEPITTTIMIAYALIDLDLSHSKRVSPLPKPDQIVGFQNLAALIKSEQR